MTMEFRQFKLDNGLEIAAEVNKEAYSVSVGFFVQVGARHEPPAVSGVSHFLEHMIFKGSDRRSASDVNRQFDEIGADANAFTTEEQTVYYASLLPDLLDDVIDLFGDILRPSLRRDDFEMEKQVILEEIMMYDDQPPFGADEKSRELFFGEHPLGNGILGSMESISRLTQSQMRTYFDEQYRPDNIVLVAAGRLDFDRLIDHAEKVCGPWTAIGHRSSRDDTRTCRVRGRRGVHQIVKESASQQHTMLLFDAPSALDEDRFAAGVLANIIGDDIGSRLYWDLIDSGLADYAAMGTCEYYDNGCFSIGLAGEPEAAEEILARVETILRDVTQNGLLREELERSKNKILSRLVLGNERPGGRLFSVGGEWIVRNEYRTVRDDMADVERLTLDDIHAVLKRYPLDDPLLLTIGPMPEPFRKNP